MPTFKMNFIHIEFINHEIYLGIDNCISNNIMTSIGGIHGGGSMMEGKPRLEDITSVLSDNYRHMIATSYTKRL